MKRSLFGIAVLVAVLFSFAQVCDVAWAFKNACPVCKKVIENQDLTDCPACGKVINKCLICGDVNPIKNDNCAKCSASLAESRVSRTIDKETREDLRLGESVRAKIDVELGQIEEKVALNGMTPDLGARQVELLYQMSWWSMANTQAIGFATQFPTSEHIARVSVCRVAALRKLGYLALEEEKTDIAKEYLKTALAIDPKDSECQRLMKKADGAK